MDIMEIGRAIVDCCERGAYLEAVDKYYADDIVSVEPGESEMRGKTAVREKTVGWIEMHEVHSTSVLGPYPHGDRFAMHLTADVTARSGPMEGQRFTMQEVCLYTVKDGKIVREEFFYSRG